MIKEESLITTASLPVLPEFPREIAERIVSALPIARFYEPIRLALAEDINQSWFCLLQLSQLRISYQILQNQISGLSFIFPVDFVQEEETQVVKWIGDHDPYGLYDCILVQAETRFEKSSDGSFKDRHLKIESSIINPLEDSPISLKDQIRRIMTEVRPDLFDKIFRSFFDVLGVYIPCPAEDPQAEFAMHPADCKFCNNEGQVQITKVMGGKFSPSSWFEMVTGVTGWTA